MTNFLHTIRAVFFDLDNTLFDHAEAERQALALVFEEHREQVKQLLAADVLEFDIRNPSDKAMLEGIYRPINERLWHDMAHQRLSKDDLKRERFSQTLRELSTRLAARLDTPRAAQALVNADNTSIDALGEHMGRSYLKHYRASWRLIPHAEQVVAAVARQVPVGLITNGFADQQLAKLAQFGWEQRFQAVVLSSEVGVMKPHKAIFDIALERMNEACRTVQQALQNTLAGQAFLPIAPAEALYIGDNYLSDVVGAHNAGWKAAWYAPPSEHPSLADLTITRLEDIAAFKFSQ
jgi:FMN phosphatase YigB (HAD superfamily)